MSGTKDDDCVDGCFKMLLSICMYVVLILTFCGTSIIYQEVKQLKEDVAQLRSELQSKGDKK